MTPGPPQYEYTAASEFLSQQRQQRLDGTGGGAMTPLTESILTHIELLDGWGAWEWNLRYVAAAAAVLFWLVRSTMRKKRGVDWYALLHALITASGSLACVYLDAVASEALTGEPEPARSCRCHGPLTSLHRILPAVTMGYALFDLIDGFTISVDFALHGLATFFLMAYFTEHDLPQFITPMLLMEVSTLFLTVVRADFFSPTMAMANQLLFALNFFLFRLVVCPLIWLKIILVLYQEQSGGQSSSCLPSHFGVVVLLFGTFFHVLNGYWFVKIVKKARRKMAGIEGVQANNDFVDEHEIVKKEK